ncbi:HAD-IIB family hydrolase [Promethearchaeum syntrophicum]|uniref:HAD-IIB family hydrolase n=1 Tax=Promethearchaeum syntrophicum TaxID=2594042 RepID=A0A5B9DFW5_9ARCH|nr:HAD-IIB family hydrolase [Candidatus Prometheoarchaeum syntrophicum]QEE17673.1 phosphoglycolate phosphatase [Candidatus Prometheoarchaeum syntrophicum]
MLKISEIPTEIVNKIEIIFCDIDDTLSFKGKILPETYSSLWDLFNNNIKIVPITGRCAGWVDHIARFWPVFGVIGENGALYMYMDNNNKLRKRYFLENQKVPETKRKLELIKNKVLTRFPTCKVASDQPYREFDLAIDFCEDVPPLPMEDVQEIVKIYEKYGATAKISSIHVNGWFGDFDKLKMTKLFAKEVLKYDLKENMDKILFVGDSPNDQPMFNFFKNSVGVANIINFSDLITHPPMYITKKKSGKGFTELVNIILSKRKKFILKN